MRRRFTGLFLAAVAALAIAGQANASTVGDPIEPEFNYAAVYLGTTIAGDLDALVVKPSAAPVKLNGTYVDEDGNFVVPQEGLEPVDFEIDTGFFPIKTSLGLAGEGSGHFDEATGDMTLDLSLALTLGVDDLEEASEVVGEDLGTGPLSCRLAPLPMDFSTANDWPHAGKAFADPAALADGAVAGAWRTKPAIVAVEGGQDVCNLLGGFLKPVGGLWLVNSSTEITGLPGWQPPECPPPGNLLLSCVPPGWEEPQHPCAGCPSGLGSTRIKLNPGKSSVRPGQVRQLTLRVRNTGDSGTVLRVRFKSSNPGVSVPGPLSLTIPAGAVINRKVKVSARSKARGKAVITASTAGLEAKATVRVKRPAKRR